MNAFLEDIKIALECAICFKRLQQPKSLSCLHTFCLGCLQNWVKQGQLVCPTCRQSQIISEGGLQKLLPNIFVNNMLECLKKVENAGNTKCFCCHQTNTEFYCQQCRISLCSICIKQHKILPTLVSHTLHPIEDIKTMTLQQFSYLHPALCPEHKDVLKYYCTKCETAICIHCTIIKHQNKDGSHYYIDISDAFDIFKQKAANTEPAVENFITKIEIRQKTIKLCLETLTKSKDTCEQEIDGVVEEAIDVVRKHGIALKQDVDIIFLKKKRAMESQDEELTTLLKKVTRTRNFISQLMKSDAATAVEVSDNAIATINQQIQNLPKIEQKDANDIQFCKDRTHVVAMRKNGIGVIKRNVSMSDESFICDEATAMKFCNRPKIQPTDDDKKHLFPDGQQFVAFRDEGVKCLREDSLDADMAIAREPYVKEFAIIKERLIESLPEIEQINVDELQLSPGGNPLISSRNAITIHIKNDVAIRLEDNFEIASREPVLVTQGQIFEVRIIQYNSHVTDFIQLKAYLKHSTGAVIHVSVTKQNDNNYCVKCYSKSIGIAHVIVYVNRKEIRGSPVHINVVKEGLSSEHLDIKPYLSNQKTKVRDIVIDKYILVAGSSNEVVRFQLCGKYVDRIYLPKGTQVNRMYYIKQSGDLLISDGGKTRILLLHSTSKENDILQWSGLREPYGLTMDESKQSKPIYVADGKAHCIFIYHLSSGELVRRVGSQGNHFLYQMEGPQDVVLTKEGNILVADYGNSRLLLLTSDGMPLKHLLKGKIYHPRAILNDKDRNIIVANTSELSVYDNEGNFLKLIARSEELEGLTIWSYSPRSIAVADYGNNKIQIFNY